MPIRPMYCGPEPFMPMQRGPCCGLYALAAVCNALGVKDIPATKGDLAADRRIGVQSLRNLAKSKGYTKIGEIFDAEDMVALAYELGLGAGIVTARTEPIDTWDATITASLRAKRYILAPFGVVPKGEPDEGMPQDTGTRPHWCVVFGGQWTVETVGGKEVWKCVELEAKHWGQRFSFGFDALRTSSTRIVDLGNDAHWFKVDRTKVLPRLQDRCQLAFGKPSEVPQDLRKEGRSYDFSGKRLSESLAGRFVSIWLR